PGTVSPGERCGETFFRTEFRIVVDRFTAHAGNGLKITDAERGGAPVNCLVQAGKIVNIGRTDLTHKAQPASTDNLLKESDKGNLRLSDIVSIPTLSSLAAHGPGRSATTALPIYLAPRLVTFNTPIDQLKG